MILGYALFFIYVLCLLSILAYSLVQGHLTILYLRSKKQGTEPTPPLPHQLPFVTVQLPIYNEQYVVERLITKVAQLDYPHHLLQIQVLDDSTDETTQLAQNLVAQLQATGLNIQHVQRQQRTGFKAGALSFGLEAASGEFIAIFDADFLPEKDFLLQTLLYFQDETIGMVQTRWEHLNRNYNLLTRLLAMALDAHFTIEQRGRNANGNFINFNGTAGIWRRTCIEDAGGWSADTLTEDLDLSYRAQLKGWKMKYLESHTSPAEIPAFMQAVRSQQYRWNKGGAEVARRNALNVLKAHLPPVVKLHALFHLFNTGIFLSVFLSAMVSVPLIYTMANEPVIAQFMRYATHFFAGFFILSVFYYTTVRQRFSHGIQAFGWFLIYFPLFLSVSMGLSLYNAIAVSEGYLGIRSPFIRTPKFNIIGQRGSGAQNVYATAPLPAIVWAEAALVIYFALGIVLAVHYTFWAFIPFHFMLTFGFAAVVFLTFKHRNAIV